MELNGTESGVKMGSHYIIFVVISDSFAQAGGSKASVNSAEY
jgi:hypothetical protein